MWELGFAVLQNRLEMSISRRITVMALTAQLTVANPP